MGSFQLCDEPWRQLCYPPPRGRDEDGGAAGHRGLQAGRAEGGGGGWSGESGGSPPGEKLKRAGYAEQAVCKAIRAAPGSQAGGGGVKPEQGWSSGNPSSKTRPTEAFLQQSR